MTKFEKIGVNMQYESASIKEAERKFAYSCDICCHRGLHINCDYCAISDAHKLTVAALNEIAEADKLAKEKRKAEAEAKAKAREKFEKAMEALTKELDESEKKARNLSRILDAMERERDFFFENSRSRKAEFVEDWYEYEDEYLDNWDRS